MFTNFEFRNFKPTHSLEDYGKRRLSELSDSTPHAFSAIATLRKKKSKTGEVYTCHLELFDDCGLFIAESKSTDPRAAIDGVENKLCGQVRDWMMRRVAISPKSLWKFSQMADRYLHPQYT